MIVYRRWHNLLDMPHRDKAWHERYMAEEFAELQAERGLINRWSEYADVVYGVTRARWNGYAVPSPISRTRFIYGSLYMFPEAHAAVFILLHGRPTLRRDVHRARGPQPPQATQTPPHRHQARPGPGHVRRRLPAPAALLAPPQINAKLTRKWYSLRTMTIEVAFQRNVEDEASRRVLGHIQPGAMGSFSDFSSGERHVVVVGCHPDDSGGEVYDFANPSHVDIGRARIITAEAFLHQGPDEVIDMGGSHERDIQLESGHIGHIVFTHMPAEADQQ